MNEASLTRGFSTVVCEREGNDASSEAREDEWSMPLEVDFADAKSAVSVWSGSEAGDDPIQVADVEEIEWLVREGFLADLRQFHSFGYTVRLYFYAAELKFYAAVYMDGILWRGLKSSDLDMAERAFEEFILHVNTRSRDEIRRVHLDARNAQLQRVVAESAAKAERLRTNMVRHAAQKQRAMERENELRNDIKKLEATRVLAQLHANRAAREIGQLYSGCASQLPRPRSTLSLHRKR